MTGAYHGKDWDNTPAAVAVAVGREEVAHSAVLTGRPFACFNRGPQPSAWLVPVVPAAAGLLLAVRLLAGDAQAAVFPAASRDKVESVLHPMVRRSAVVVGPALTPLFASRPATHFSTAAANFLCLCEASKNGSWLVHDLEGCPFLRMTGDDLEAALREAEVAVAVTPSATWDAEAALRTAWKRGVDLRFEHCARANGAALRDVAGHVGDALRGSEAAALRATIPGLGVARTQLAAAARSLGLEKTVAILDDAVAAAAACAAALTAGEAGALAGALRSAAAVEDALDSELAA